MCINNLLPIFQVLSYFAAAGAFVFTAYTYFRNNKVKRGEWLKALYEKFFEAEQYKEIRKEIDYKRLHIYLKLDEKAEIQNDTGEEKLADFLNFFEFISILQHRNHISKDEVNDLFGYYFDIIKGDKFLKNYTQKFGFEHLTKKLNENK